VAVTGAAEPRTAEFAEEALQGMVVRQLIQAAAAEIEGEVAAFVGGRLGLGLNTHGNDSRGNGRNHVCKARSLRRGDRDRGGVGRGKTSRYAARKHDGRKTGHGGGLQYGLQRGTCDVAHCKATFSLSSFQPEVGQAVDDDRYRRRDLNCTWRTDENL